MTENCMNCRFVKKPKAIILENAQATCRRNPPQITMVPSPKGIMQMTAWPQVTAKDWCGQHDTTALREDGDK